MMRGRHRHRAPDGYRRFSNEFSSGVPPVTLAARRNAKIGYVLGIRGSNWYGHRALAKAAIGGVGGAVAGEAIERSIKRKDGIEILVRLDQSDTIAVVRDGDIAFSPGDRVQLLTGRDGSARVQPIWTQPIWTQPL
jgi:outer membrane lipoprotein SlyB